MGYLSNIIIRGINYFLKAAVQAMLGLANTHSVVFCKFLDHHLVPEHTAFPNLPNGFGAETKHQLKNLTLVGNSRELI